MTMLLIAVYLIIAITLFNRKPVGQSCRNIELTVKDSVNTGFITKQEVANILQQRNLYPVGQKMERVRLKPIEKAIKGHPLVEEAECYKTPGGNICIEVHQRIPILRVLSENGDNYYVDSRGKVMPPEIKYATHIAIVTGKVEKSFIMKDLYKFGVFLQNNPFWDAQIEQINVLPSSEIELVPRVGDHIIFLGKIQHFDQKLERLKVFYEKALNKVGWNKYSRISVEFSNQIICTKRDFEQ